MSEKKSYLSLIIWILFLVVMGYSIGLLTQGSVNTWYLTLHRSPLSPPNYLFGIVWTILYIMIAMSGWLIWNAKSFKGLNLIKIAFITQLILNWSWTPLFFSYHLIDMALICLLLITILVTFMIVQSFHTIKGVSLLLTPYLLWLLFAFYLNFYIWQYN